MIRKIVSALFLFSGAATQSVAMENNSVVYEESDYLSEETAGFEPFEQQNIWACYVIYDGNGRNIYYKGSPSNTKSQVIYFAMRQCRSANPDPAKCRLSECRFGPY